MNNALAIPLSRRERERSDRRREMLVAALAVFAERGYDQATIEQVAERAEFGKGTLYNYFPGGKEAILLALFDEMYDGMRGVIADHFATTNGRQPNARDAFRGMIAQLIDHFAENRAAFLLLMKEAQRLMLGREPEILAFLRGRSEAVIAEMVPAIEAAMAEGQLKTYPPKAVAHVLMGNVKGYLMYAFSAADYPAVCDQLWPPVEEAADFITEILFDGLLKHNHR